MKTLISVGLALLTTQVVAEEKHICTYDGVERSIEVVYSEPASKVPCAVIYSKSGLKEVAWQAQNQVGYCEEKAQGLSDKLASHGWVCTKP